MHHNWNVEVNEPKICLNKPSNEQLDEIYKVLDQELVIQLEKEELTFIKVDSTTKISVFFDNIANVKLVIENKPKEEMPLIVDGYEIDLFHCYIIVRYMGATKENLGAAVTMGQFGNKPESEGKWVKRSGLQRVAQKDAVADHKTAGVDPITS
ncbi:hypothetical protein E3N88_18419 [Mikania micrantha]|uniref:Uncharacterized protein n=1 Tax=Mikania micrantha TaxID=192012 RepID=A0A5N6NM64_9ASTR|nr:hypothetical protein E3N88_18419 [Mikania micrantha]